jgi:predicted DNA-binding transcriptional regulator AlpA
MRHVTINPLLSLADVQRVTGLSGSTVRRYIKEGKLRPEPRENAQAPYWISLDSVLAAGLKLIDDPQLRDTRAGIDPAAQRRLRAEYDSLQERYAVLVAENASLRERAARAEGALEATNRLLEKMSTMGPLLRGDDHERSSESSS